MKKLFLLSLCCIIGLAFAQQSLPAGVHQALQWTQTRHSAKQSLDAPDYFFTHAPDSLFFSHYDYMIGSFNSLPLRTIPDAEGGGYCLTFHVKATPTGVRSVFYAHVNAAGDITRCNRISNTLTSEGYPAVAVDQVSGVPMYAWHAPVLGGDNSLKVLFAYIPLIDGLPDPMFAPQIVIDNPVEIFPTDDNVFLWPQIQIGPSPNPEMRRVYVAASNLVSHALGGMASPNFMIAYADFNTHMLNMGNTLSWSYTTVPELDQWNHDPGLCRYPSLAFNVDGSGNIFLAGYHKAYTANGGIVADPDLDVFICPDYGQGTWTHANASSHIPTWDPEFYEPHILAKDLPFPEGDLHWKIMNSGHLNAVSIGDGKILFPALFTVSTDSDAFYPDLHTVKAVIHDSAEEEFTIREIYPQKDPDDDYNAVFTPWDWQAPWGEPEWVLGDDGEYYLDLVTLFPFAHWDASLHNNAMMVHYNNLKVSEVNDQGMIVAVWQNAQRAMLLDKSAAQDPDLDGYPEIMISVSPNSGKNWSEPIRLNSIDNPALDGITPMWVYPADLVKYMGMQGDSKIGRLGLVFYDDYTWGANAVSPPAHTVNDGGRVMFAELQIVFPDFPSGTDDPSPAAPAACSIKAAYPNPFKDRLSVSLQVKDASQDYKFKIYNVKGQLVHSATGTAKGNFDLSWDGRDVKGTRLPSGIYLLSLSTKGQQTSRKVILY
ncbi:MAG: T9SS type A sorting domain-containing protein [Candidatus Cloacimonetes bacterium]|nr:T9SS type A sorting domain-containing protein [Candidatus Cloacimonadota bacterium]MDY0172149.1 T9SS type A sorting domain-containing protein [Candidatus Cloacimonadaceae bacterium]